MENAFGILACRFKVLVCTMKQRPKVVRDIDLTARPTKDYFNHLGAFAGKEDRI